MYRLDLQRQQTHLDEIKLDLVNKKQDKNSLDNSLDDNKNSMENLAEKQTKAIAGMDATQFYASGSHQKFMRKKTSKRLELVDGQNAELISECYIGFTKLLNDELRTFNLKTSVFLDSKKVASNSKSPSQKTMNSESLEFKQQASKKSGSSNEGS